MINLSAIIPSPLGKKIGIHIQNDKLYRLSFESEDAPLKSAQDPVSQQVADELASYFENPKHRFNLEFDLNGTSFQRKVWKALQSIPPGKTLSYGALAESLQTGPRAVGQACRTNPILIIVPCHRIVSAQHLGGYSGERDGTMLDFKKWLLTHEGAL